VGPREVGHAAIRFLTDTKSVLHRLHRPEARIEASIRLDSRLDFALTSSDDAKFGSAADHARIGFIDFLERIFLDHRRHSGHLGNRRVSSESVEIPENQPGCSSFHGSIEWVQLQSVCPAPDPNVPFISQAFDQR